MRASRRSPECWCLPAEFGAQVLDDDGPAGFVDVLDGAVLAAALGFNETERPKRWIAALNPAGKPPSDDAVNGAAEVHLRLR